MSDLLDGVVEELGGYVDQRVLNENDATHLSASDLEHRARGQLTDVGVLVREASEQLLQDR